MQNLVLKTVSSKFLAHRGFRWPESGRVTCPDWNPEPVCGGGLHGLLWGEGFSGLLDHSSEAKWLVLEVDSEKIVDLGGKVKFPECNVLYAGERDVAIGLILERNPGAACVFAKKIVGDYGIAHVGNYGKATAGYCGTATAGHYGTAIAGHYGTAIAGDRGTATAGDGGKATAGHGGTAIAGRYGMATAGDGGTATAGNYGTATAGECGTATAGDRGKATAGYRGTAIAGNDGKAKVGKGGRIEIEYFDGKRYRKLVGYEGEEIEADKFYRAEGGKFVEAEE